MSSRDVDWLVLLGSLTGLLVIAVVALVIA